MAGDAPFEVFIRINNGLRDLAGNPGDVTLTTDMIARHKSRHGVAPKQAAFDGAFASQENLRALKSEGVVDVAFAKRCGPPWSLGFG